MEGSLFLAEPYENPFPEPQAGHPNGSLLAVYIVAKFPERGLLVKLAGKVEANPVTGQLTTTFDNLPQLPFAHFRLHFREGQSAPLASPPTCGTFTTEASFVPWSAANLSDPAPEEVVHASSSFTITKGVHEGACPAGGVPPFAPQVVSGTQNNAAGSYSPFYLRIVREDGEQELTRFTTVLPPGLTGNLSGIPFCPDSAIEAARLVSGRQELGEPSCPVASKIGHTLVGAGVGNVLAQTPGSLYLAGPYHGASLSLVSITSATVGPFDLGTEHDLEAGERFAAVADEDRGSFQRDGQDRRDRLGVADERRGGDRAAPIWARPSRPGSSRVRRRGAPGLLVARRRRSPGMPRAARATAVVAEARRVTLWRVSTCA